MSSHDRHPSNKGLGSTPVANDTPHIEHSHVLVIQKGAALTNRLSHGKA
jgi:hypothetical protein